VNSKFKYWCLLLGVTLVIFNFCAIGWAAGLGVRDLEEGMRGHDVKLLQQRLINLGYNIKVDGVFGAKTKNIIKKFQQKYDLSPDGIVGTQTLYYLKRSNKNLEYEVQPGDSLYELSKEYNISIKEIKEANNLSNSRIIVGQKLIIPDTALGGGEQKDLYITVEYRVKSGDSLYKLAKEYDSKVTKIRKVNNLQNSLIRVGQEIEIPRKLNKPKTKKVFSEQERMKFIWPVRARISSNYGYRTHPITHEKDFHGGIDLAVGHGTPVKAAASGRVVTSSWVSGFGKTVIIKHDGRTKTLYAHNSRLKVRVGQYVKQGQTISYSGNTGLSTGPHLDFRILINGDPVNPLKWLPN